MHLEDMVAIDETRYVEVTEPAEAALRLDRQHPHAILLHPLARRPNQDAQRGPRRHFAHRLGNEGIPRRVVAKVGQDAPDDPGRAVDDDACTDLPQIKPSLLKKTAAEAAVLVLEC